MADTPEAAPEAPQAPETEAQPTTNEPAVAPAPEVNAEQVAKFFGTDAETLGKFQKFVEANGKFDSAFSKMKADISNPQKATEAPQTTSEPKNDKEPAPQPQTPVEAPKTPEGAITAQEFLAKQYFQSLAEEEKYAAISKGIANGEYLKEMSAFGISPLNQDGSINDQKVRMYLDLKAQTVPAQATSSEPNASPAPTVDYVATGPDGAVTTAEQAYSILQQDAQLKAAGMGSHPAIAKAEQFISEMINGKKPEDKKK